LKSKLNHNILYLTYDGLSDPLGQSQILPYLERLVEKGHGITVISFEKAESGNQKDEIGNQKGEKQKSNGGRLKVVPLRYHKSPPVLSTIYDIYVLKSAVKKELKNAAGPAGGQHFDIIHCRSYITSLVGLWAKRKYGAKFIFDMRGFWADERVEGGLWNLKNPVFKWIYQFFKKKEKQFLLDSDAVISLTHNAKLEIELNIPTHLNKSTNNQLNISVIPTCTDLDLFNPNVIAKKEIDQLKSDLDIRKDDFVLLYLGSLGTWYMLEQMLDFFEMLKHKTRDLKSGNWANTKFLFLSKDQEELNAAIKSRQLRPEDFINTSCSRQDVPKYIAICHASIFFILPTYSKKASAATKMGEVMAMGKPVITNTGLGDVEAIIPKTKSGVLVRELTASGYQKAIEDYNATVFDPQQIRAQATELFSLEKGVEQYAQIYQRLQARIEK
jgi:glycosyltransferase involved in cell wall biosynthesis